MSMVFQNYALYGHKSVRDNIAYPLRVRGTPRAEISHRAATSLREPVMPSSSNRIVARMPPASIVSAPRNLHGPSWARNRSARNRPSTFISAGSSMRTVATRIA